MPRRDAPGTPWYRTPMMWLLIAFPLASVLGGFATLWLAIQSDDGLVVDDYYRRGKEINLALGRDRAAAERGMRAVLYLDRSLGEMRIELHGGGALPERLDVLLLHATRAGHDRRYSLARGPAGHYRADLERLAPGRYHVQLAAGEWRLLGSLHLPGEARVEILPAVAPAGS